MSASANQSQLACSQLERLKQEIKRCNTTKKGFQDEYNTLADRAVDAMMNQGLRCISAVPDKPPYYVLTKRETGGGWNAAAYLEFFTQLLNTHKARPVSPEECAQRAEEYLRTRKKRSIKLEKRMNREQQTGVQDLKEWLEQGPE